VAVVMSVLFCHLYGKEQVAGGLGVDYVACWPLPDQIMEFRLGFIRRFKISSVCEDFIRRNLTFLRQWWRCRWVS
jgi:hypothetical protein